MTVWNREDLPNELIKKTAEMLDKLLEGLSDGKAKTYSRGAVLKNKNVTYKIERYDKNEVDFSNSTWIVKDFIENHTHYKDEEIVVPEFIGYLEALDKTGYININTKTKALIEMGAQYFDVHKFL